jgi:hypothetical protein
MKKYMIDGHLIKADCYYRAYSKYFNITIAQAISERDHPASKEDCIGFFIEATNRAPSEDEILQMKPDLESFVEMYFGAQHAV